MGNYLDESNYTLFGNRRIIPGLKPHKEICPKDSNFRIFTGFQYDPKTISGTYAGFEGLASPYDGGNIELYGGIGNIAVGGVKFSHTFSDNDNFSYRGYVKANGAVSLTNKREFTTDIPTEYHNTTTEENHLISDAPGQVTYVEGFNVEGVNPDGIWDNNVIYHDTNIFNKNNFNVKNNACISGDLPDTDFKTAIGGEVVFTNNKGDFEVGLGGEIGFRSHLAVKSEYVPNYKLTQYASLNSAEFNDDAIFEINYRDLANNFDADSNFQSSESLTINNNYDIGGAKTSLDIDSQLYGALNGWMDYRYGRFGLNLGAGITYSDKQFTPTFKAGINYTLGTSPIIHSHGTRIIGKRNPINSNMAMFMPCDYPEATLNLFVRGQAIDGVNGVAAGLEGEIPLNNKGTAMGISAAVGNFVSLDVNVSQTNPFVNDNWALRSSIGAKIDYSLTNKTAYDTEGIITYESDYYTNTVPMNDWLIEHGIIDMYNEHNYYNSSCQYFINETGQILTTNKAEINANSMKAYGTLGLSYKKDNWTIEAEIEGGFRNTDISPKISYDAAQFDASSEYNIPWDANSPLGYSHNSGYNTDGINGWTYNSSGVMIVNMQTGEHVADHHAQQIVNLIVYPTDEYQTPGVYVYNKLLGETNVNYTGITQYNVSYIPKFAPYLNGKLGIKYEFGGNNAIGGNVNYDGHFGASITYTRKLNIK